MKSLVKEVLLPCLSLLVFGILTFLSLVTTHPVKQPIQTAKEETVLIETAAGWGSGVIVTVKEHGHQVSYVWTVTHVVYQPETLDLSLTNNLADLKIKDVTVYLHDGHKAPAEVVAYSHLDDRRDLAILRIKKLDWTTVTTTFAHDAPPEIGTQVFHIGNFYGPKAHHSFSEGFISYNNRRWDGWFDQVNISIYPGSSGGGMFLMDGECIGLCDARAEETMTFIIPVRQMRQWATEHGFRYLLK